MTATLFFQSMWVGLAIAAPVGPIGVLVIQRTLRHGVPVGLVTGLGAAVADAACGALGAFGVSILFIAIFGALAGSGAPVSPGAMVAGVLAGSALWWLLLCAAVGLLRARFDAVWRRRVARISALMLAAFALWQWASLLAR